MNTPSMISRVRAYLAQRRALGFRLRSEGYLLLNFARYADRRRRSGPLTNKLAITWARLPKVVDRHCWARRLEAVRRLAKHLAVTDPRTEIPPRHLFGPSKRPYQPFLYSVKQISQLLRAACQLSGQLRPHTFQTLIGLLACTGLRVSEALQLKVADVDLEQGLLLVREGKFHQTRWVPLHATALPPLRRYSQQRQKHLPLAEHFFVSESGTRLPYSTVHSVFSRLRRIIAHHEGQSPRIHDLRHHSERRIIPSSRQGAGKMLRYSVRF